jgi:hypothetical protein
MKLVRMLIAAALCYTSSISIAQTSQKATITDDDLKKYAITMDSVQGMQQTLNDIIAENVRENQTIEVKRYNELFKVEKDETKLQALGATPEERAFLKDIAELRDYNLKRINVAYQALAKDYVGLKTFNAIKKSLDTDPSLKARFESIDQQVKNGTSTEAAGSKGR